MYMTELSAFLNARCQLPNPATFKEKIYIISVGERPMPYYTNAHIYADFVKYIFVFNKKRSVNTASNYEWVCDNKAMQSIIDETQVYAVDTLLKYMFN